MRGAKAKALRRLASKSALPDVVYGQDTKLVTLSAPTLEDQERTFQIPVGQRKLGPSKRGLVKRAKARIGSVPIVALHRRARQQEEGLKGMEIVPIDNPTPEIT